MSKEISQERHDELYDRLAITKHFINKIQQDGYPPITDLNQLKDIVCQYTGVKEEIVKEALNYKKKKTFTDLYIFSEETQHCHFNPSACFLRFEDVRRIIIDLYLNQLQIPNKKSIFEALVKLERYKDYFLSNLETDMYYIGFIWKRLPNSKKYIVVEKSEQLMRRMKYLQRMREYRSNDRVLIHVEKSSIKLNLPVPFDIILAACPQLGLIQFHVPVAIETMESWLKTIIHEIPPNSVFVMQLASVTEETIDWIPKINSPKKDLIKWLEANGISHDPNNHSADLYTLVQKYKCFYPPTYKFIPFLEAAGHEVVVRPSELNDRYFDFSFLSLDKFVDASNKQQSVFVRKSVIQGMIKKKFSEYSLLRWLKEDRKMADREMQMYEEEQKLELILDNLMDKINDGSMSEADFDGCDGKECDLSICDRLFMPNNL